MKNFLIILLLSIGSHSFSQSLKWTEIDNGIAYTKLTNQNANSIFIAFGGWTAEKNWVCTWLENLSTQVPKSIKIKHLFAVKGPQNSLYKDREINSKLLAEKITDILKSQKISKKTHIIVVAHSSGAYVAHDFLNFLFALDSINQFVYVKNKVSYFNLDGGLGIEKYKWTSLQQSHIQHFRAIYGVYAFDNKTGIYSPNKDEMLRVAKLGSNCSALEVNADNSNCQNTWCVHETVIIQNPYNINTFDLKNDYTNFNETRKICSDYLKVLTQK